VWVLKGMPQLDQAFGAPPVDPGPAGPCTPLIGVYRSIKSTACVNDVRFGVNLIAAIWPALIVGSLLRTLVPQHNTCSNRWMLNSRVSLRGAPTSSIP